MSIDLPRFDTTRVLVVGDVMLDRYWHGGTSRISPEAPVPVVKVKSSEDSPGGAGNVALNIAALGAAASLVGVVGTDENGQILQTRLNAAGVFCDFQKSIEKPTVTKLRIVSRHQQLIRMDFEEQFLQEDANQVSNKSKEMLGNNDVVIISDYQKGALHQVKEIISEAKNKGVPVLVDPKGEDFSIYAGATILKPNLHEFELVAGPCETEDELISKGQAMLLEIDLEALLITRGEQGMSLIRRDQPVLHFPARAREVYDVTGAGDTVVSVLAASMGAGLAMAESVSLANIAAGLIVAKLGTATVTGPELRRELQRDNGSHRGVVSKAQLLLAIADAREHGEKIVFTNGCFDIIHAGHVGYLQDAKEQGDRLIVAINDDESVSRLKGPGRPINPIERRMAVVAGLESVDWVVSFGEDTPETLLEVVKPDMLIKGGDYGLEEVVGSKFVQSYGGGVKVLSFIDDCSTSAIVEKIQEKN